MIARCSSESWSRVAMKANDSVPRMADTTASLHGEDNMATALGFDIHEVEPDLARGGFEVTDRVRQPFGIVHGGAYAALGETLASVGTYRAVYEDGMAAMGQSNYTSFLRPVSEGYVNAEARPLHRGRSTWVWDVEFTDGNGKVCAITRVTMAVRPAPG
jgi:1,4-dihydroxy-2-naphthoyl-CoA hydrolase